MNDNPARAAPVAAGDEASADLCAVAALKARVGEAVGRRRAEFEPGGPLPVDWPLLAASVRQLERLADIGSGVPDLPRFSGPMRLVGRVFARCVLYFSRFLTNRQREYNHAVLNALRNLANGLRRLEERHEEELRRLRAELRERAGDFAKKAA